MRCGLRLYHHKAKTAGNYRAVFRDFFYFSTPSFFEHQFRKTDSEKKCRRKESHSSLSQFPFLPIKSVAAVFSPSSSSSFPPFSPFAPLWLVFPANFLSLFFFFLLLSVIAAVHFHTGGREEQKRETRSSRNLNFSYLGGAKQQRIIWL